MARSTKQKGAEWEWEFSQYMKDELGYSECIMNSTVKGKLSTNEYEVDIIGKKLSEKGENYKLIGHVLLGLACIVIFSQLFFDIVLVMENDMFILGAVFIAGFVFLQSAKAHEWEYSWVECKNHQKPIDKKVFQNLKLNVEDYHNTEDKKFDFKDMILASKSGFTRNSLRFGENYEIRCYDKSIGEIMETDMKNV